MGVYFDDNLSMSTHVTNLSRSVYLEIRRLKKYVTLRERVSFKTLAASFIFSRLDYCNSLFKNIKSNQLDQLQKHQNFAAKVFLGKSLFQLVTPCLIELHWLRIRFHIDFKIALLVFKCINGLALYIWQM